MGGNSNKHLRSYTSIDASPRGLEEQLMKEKQLTIWISARTKLCRGSLKTASQSKLFRKKLMLKAAAQFTFRF
jgi:hypothetical protein